jgi:spermidine synthase
MSVSLEPLAWDFDNWRNTLVSYKIDGRTVLDLTSAAGRQRLEYLMSFKTGLTVPAAVRTWSPYRILRADPPRTADKLPVTDDNMGSEYRHNLGFE